MYVQSPNAVVMIRPHNFRSNPETQGNNAFQKESIGDVAEAARRKMVHDRRSAPCPPHLTLRK
tara:strand:- start:1838 stop:2026 length:189 start_codon:yes stop_codon:yes gene_type:complete